VPYLSAVQVRASTPSGAADAATRAVGAAVWVDIVEALPRVNVKTSILSVVDWFSKYCHFIPHGGVGGAGLLR
jgi:hypothetical protein